MSTALIFGALTALAWGTGSLLSARSSRTIGPLVTVAWVVLVGLSLAIPIAAFAGWPQDLEASTVGWLFLAGLTNVLGFGFVYAAFTRGSVGVVTAIVSTEGALAACIAIAAGERPSNLTIAALFVVAAGAALVSATPSAGTDEAGSSRWPVVLLAFAAAALFSVTLFASGQASDAVPAAWVALPARVVGVVLLLGALPFGLRPGRPGGRMKFAAAAGVTEVVGLMLFAVGARDSIAITSVAASQFGAVAAIGAFFLYKERLVRRQILGIALIAVGVALVVGAG